MFKFYNGIRAENVQNVLFDFFLFSIVMFHQTSCSMNTAVASLCSRDAGHKGFISVIILSSSPFTNLGRNVEFSSGRNMLGYEDRIITSAF